MFSNLSEEQDPVAARLELVQETTQDLKFTTQQVKYVSTVIYVKMFKFRNFLYL